MSPSKPEPPASSSGRAGSSTGAFKKVTTGALRVGAAGAGRRTRGAVVRRQPTGVLAVARMRARRLWRSLLATLWLWVGLFLAVATWSLLPRPLFFAPQLAAGAIAGRTVVADRELTVANAEETRKLQARARDEVLPVYDFDRAVEERKRAQLAALFAAGRAALEAVASAPSSPAGEAEPPPGEDRLARLAEVSQMKLTAEQEELLRGEGFTTELEDRLAGIITRILRRGVVSGKDLLLEHRVRGVTLQMLPAGEEKVQLDLFRYLDYPDEVREVILQELRPVSGLSSSRRARIADFLLANLAPNLTPNNSETLARRRRAAEQVGTVTQIIPRGKVIVRKGDEVDAVVAEALGQLAGERAVRAQLLTGLGTVMLAFAMLLVVWLGLRRESPVDRTPRRLLAEGLLLLTGHLLGMRFAYFVSGAIGSAISLEPFANAQSYVYAIPFGALALVAVLLYGRNVALVLVLAFSLLVGRFAGAEMAWQLVLYSFAGSLAAVYALDAFPFKQRTVTGTAGVLMGSANVVTVLMLSALGGGVAGGLGRLGFDLLCAFTGGVLAGAITSFAVPILESLLGITTHIKLIELANPNLPLLRRLAFEAPGSFQHSLAVANLSKAGCEAIDADAVLVNTCALYHDVGKIVRPRYFIENQNPGQNPHDKIQPSMSALILINHVKEGLELAEAARLPTPILDAIEQHHGTRLIKFFYRRAQDRCDPDTEAVREDEFRYPGPKPRSKEMGVLMLADGVEAASRTLVDPSRQKIRTMLRQLFDDCLQDNQLDRTDLTLGDLRQVEEAFLRILTNIYHRRIDYPGFDFNQPRKSKRSAELAPAGAERKAS